MQPDNRNRPAENGAAPESGWQADDSVAHPSVTAAHPAHRDDDGPGKRAPQEAEQLEIGQTPPSSLDEGLPADVEVVEARRRRDVGAQVAEHATDVAWKLAADRAIAALAATGRVFDAEDVRQIVGMPVAASGNALGARFLQAAKRGTIVAAGYRTARRPEARCRALKAWRGA